MTGLMSFQEVVGCQARAISVSARGKEFTPDTKLEPNCVRRYELISMHGAGKSMLLADIAAEVVPCACARNAVTYVRHAHGWVGLAGRAGYTGWINCTHAHLVPCSGAAENAHVAARARGTCRA